MLLQRVFESGITYSSRESVLDCDTSSVSDVGEGLLVPEFRGEREHVTGLWASSKIRDKSWKMWSLT